jgi:hypothetical protein
MEKTLNVTLAIVVDTELEKVGNIVDNLTFKVEEDSENVEVKDTEVVDFFEVW